MTSLRGIEVVDKDYTKRRIRIAFNPIEERFEVTNPAIERDSTWIADVSEVLKPGAQIFSIMNTYLAANPDVDQNQVTGSIQRLKDMDVKQVGVIQLAEHLDIETVNEIFIRVNSKGVSLSQADFVMSKIAASEQHGGHQLRKAIDYFSRLSRYPDFLETIGRDSEFKPEYLNKMRWLASYDDDIYQPDYTDMLRVAFTSEFGRGRLQDLVALLSGRDFETKQNFESIAEESFARLEAGVLQFMNETHFKRFAMIIRSAGFITPKLLNSGNALNFAYVVYLKGRADGIEQHQLERLVTRWYAMSILTGRYSGSAETAFDRDIRLLTERGLERGVQQAVSAALGENFWEVALPEALNTSRSTTTGFLAYQAAQVRANDYGFLSQSIRVPDLLVNRTDIHHIYPADFLKRQGLSSRKYNQVANYVLAQQEINIRIGNKDPQVYFSELREQVRGGATKYGGITDEQQLRDNLAAHCIPARMLDDPAMPYEEFLEQRRYLMAQKVKAWFESL